MASTIITKNSSTVSAVPLAGSLVQGELAVNVTDRKIYTKDSSGNVVLVASSSSLADGVTLTGTQTMTNKTITNVILDGSITEDVFTLTGTALNPANGTVQTITLSANTIFTDSLTTGQSMILGIDDGTARTVTWPTITWTTIPAAAPTLPTTGFLWVVLWKVGSTLYGKY